MALQTGQGEHLRSVGSCGAWNTKPWHADCLNLVAGVAPRRKQQNAQKM